MELSNYAKIFKALANEQRLKIFMMIYSQCCQPSGSEKEDGVVFVARCNCQPGRTFHKAFTAVCDCLDLSRSTISHHFKELQNAGLITCEREGQTFHCSVNEEALSAIRQFLADPVKPGC